MKWTELVTLMDAEAARMEDINEHSAAILLREGAEVIRQLDMRIPPAPPPPRDAFKGRPPRPAEWPSWLQY